MAGKKHRIVLVDDHEFVSEALKLHLEDNHKARLDVVATPRDGKAAVDDVRRLTPDLVVLDLNLPRMGGLAALQEIKKGRPCPLVLVLSSYDDRAHVVEAIRLGADDYLFKKDSPPERIADHILRALAKGLPAQDEVHRHLFDALRAIDKRNLDTGVTELTGTEMEILKLAAYRGLSAKEISQELSRGTMSIRTVATHWQHIYSKLGARSQAQAVCMAVKMGVISADYVEMTR